MTRIPATAILALPAAASGQVTYDTTATFALTWQELDAAYLPVANPNGALDPGERAWLRLTVSFTNQNGIGTIFGPVNQPSGTIRGLGAGFIDLDGTNSGPGVWNVDRAQGFGPDPVWDLIGPTGWGTPVTGGASLRAIQFGQFPLTPQAINDTNPIPDIWTGVWTPASYLIRSVAFQSIPGTGSGGFAASILLRISPTMLASGFIVPSQVNLGGVIIPVIPAPAGILALAPLIARRRRRGAKICGMP